MPILRLEHRRGLLISRGHPGLSDSDGQPTTINLSHRRRIQWNPSMINGYFCVIVIIINIYVFKRLSEKKRAPGRLYKPVAERKPALHSEPAFHSDQRSKQQLLNDIKSLRVQSKSYF